MFLTHYVGPILIAKQFPAEEVAEFRACSNTKCKIYRKQNRVQGRHCHECGAEVKNYKGKPYLIKRPRNFEVHEGLQKRSLLTDALWLNDFVCLDNNSDCVVYMPNNYLNTKPPARFHVGNAGNCATLICDRKPEDEILWFKTTYKDYIDFLSSMYENVEVHWAILNYQS